MGSQSDFDVVKKAADMLSKLSIDYTIRVISAHRTPAAAAEVASNAQKDGYSAIIAAAGKAAHLGGVLAAYTVLPVIGIPIKSSFMDGMDSLLSMVQMPKGIPVATVAVDGAENAAILAAQMIALSDEGLRVKLEEYKESMARDVEKQDKAVNELISK
ncbi:MAG: 5-(carboxyamino)imidazole ribonucleotide mutase [Clostridiales bacterium]|nr:5-(carboxyamino)imidazole ribonucleotide mutase [Clostridiales bacterium]